MLGLVMLLGATAQGQITRTLEETETHAYNQPPPHDRLLKYMHQLEVSVYFMDGEEPIPFELLGRRIRINGQEMAASMATIIRTDLSQHWRNRLQEGLYIFDLLPDSLGKISEIREVVVDDPRTFEIIASLLREQTTFQTFLNPQNGPCGYIRVRILRQKILVEETHLDGSPVGE